MSAAGLDTLTFGLPTHLAALQSEGRVQDFSLSTPGDGASKQELESWEKLNYPYKLPKDLLAFLLFSNGMDVSWSIPLLKQAPQPIPSGAIHILPLRLIKRLALDTDDQAAIGGKAANSEEKPVVAAFDLEKASPDVGRIVLAYVSGTVYSSPDPQVWLQDLGGAWHTLANSFTDYFRMASIHLGIRGWQYIYTPDGPSPQTEHCMRLFCPQRLAFDRIERENEAAR
jgi:tubulin polyglutamylase complex subunit 2